MAQENGIFSVRRPRETLGSINPNLSSIPLPASAMKRSKSVTNMQQPPHTANHARSISGSRMSLAPGRPSQPVFQRSSSGTNLPDVVVGTAQRASTSAMFNSTNGRKSFAPGNFAFVAATPASSQSPQRRSSGYPGRQSASMGQAGKRSFFSSAPAPAGVAKVDPRPLKDRAYQAEMRQGLLQYMTDNNFEFDTKHTLSQNSLTSPSQKDFSFMFQWLYNRVDPDYRFMQKSIEAEVPYILKNNLRYPYQGNITKSQLGAVGANNWPTFLGLLHWMMQLAKQMENYGRDVYEDAALDGDCRDVVTNRLIWEFNSSAYLTWIYINDSVDDSDSDALLRPHIDQLAAKFDAANSDYIHEVKALEDEHRSLQDQIDELSRSESRIDKLNEQIRILEDDKGKFEVYHASMEARCKKADDKAQKLDQEILKMEEASQEVELEKATLKDAVDRQKLTIQEIDRMNSERERLQKGSETSMQRLEELTIAVTERERTAGQKLETLQRKVQEYNSLGYTIGIMPSTAALARGQNFELQLKVNEGPNFSSSRQKRSNTPEPERLLADANTGYQAHNLLNLDLRGAIKQNIMELRKSVIERRNVAAEEDHENKDLLEKIRDAMDDKAQEIETLAARLRNAEEEYEKTRDNATAQKMNGDAQIERLERDLARTRTSMTESVQSLEQREMSTNIAYEQLTVRAAALREELHTEIERMLNDIIKFKIHIQKNLADYEDFVADEVEKENEEEAAEADLEEEVVMAE